MKISSIFVAFLENMNFKKVCNRAHEFSGLDEVTEHGAPACWPKNNVVSIYFLVDLQQLLF